MAQGFQLHEPELWAFLSLDDGPTWPGFGMAGPGWLTALGRAWHITSYTGPDTSSWGGAPSTKGFGCLVTTQPP